MLQIAIATKNKGKIREIKNFFNDFPDMTGIRWLTFKDFENFPDVEECEDSFLENARIKAKNVAEFTGVVTLADDSGLVVDALNGAPGVKSSRYSGTGATDKTNRIKLLSELAKISSIKERRARFVCRMVLWEPGKGLLHETSGICEGYIGFDEKGTNGFGYDCIFIPEGYKKTMAQLSQKEKNKISHRGRALQNLAGFLKKLI